MLVLDKSQVELHWDRSGLKTGATTIGRGAGGSHATQLVLAGKFAAKLGELSNEALADLDKGIFGGDGAVCLDADEELRDIRVGHWNQSVISMIGGEEAEEEQTGDRE